MSLSAILDAIRAAGEAQIRQIENNCDLQIQEIMQQANLDVDTSREQALAAALAPSFGERARIIHQARQRALQTIGNVRESVVDAALDQAKGHLAGMRTDAAYPDVLRSLAEEATTELQETLKDPRGYSMEADPRDRKLLEDILSDKKINTTVNYSLEVWGGLIARSLDNRVVVINTLEARLERASPFLRRYLAAFFESVHQKVEEQWVAT